MKLYNILPYTIKKKLARLDEYFVRYLDFCDMALKTFLRKFQRQADGVLAIMPIEQRVIAV